MKVYSQTLVLLLISAFVLSATSQTSDYCNSEQGNCFNLLLLITILLPILVVIAIFIFLFTVVCFLCKTFDVSDKFVPSVCMRIVTSFCSMFNPMQPNKKEKHPSGNIIQEKCLQNPNNAYTVNFRDEFFSSPAVAEMC